MADLDLDAAIAVAAKCQAVATNKTFRAEGIQVDVTHEYSVRRIFKHMVALFGRVDYCVNCAGVSTAALPVSRAARPPRNSMINPLSPRSEPSNPPTSPHCRSRTFSDSKT